MKKIRNYIIVTLMLLLLFSTNAYMQGDIAVSGPTVTLSSLNSKEASTIKTTCEDINKTVYEMSSKTGIEDSDVKILSYTKDNEFSDGESGIVMNVRFNAWLYNRLNSDQRMEVMDIVLSGIEQSDLSSISKSRLYNIISNSDEATANLTRQLSKDVKADFASVIGSSFVKDVFRWMRIILGIVAWLMFLFLGMAIVMDIAYITIPVWQCWVDARNDSPENTQDKPILVSIEARNAVMSAENSIGSSSFREPIGIYAKLKSKQLMMCALCLLYLLSGEIYNLLGAIIDSFGEFVRYI